MQFWEGKEPYPQEHKGFKILENQKVQMNQKLFGERKAPFLTPEIKEETIRENQNHNQRKKKLWKGHTGYILVTLFICT